MPSSKKRLRHLITVFSAIPRSSAISALFTPAAAANTILARSTIRAWAVPLRVTASNRARSSSLNSITKGLRRDNSTPKVLATRHHTPHQPQTYTRVVTRSTTKLGQRPSEPSQWLGSGG